VARTLWRQWWLVAAAWYACAVVSTFAMRQASREGMTNMITLFANLVVGWSLVAPLAIYQGLRTLRRYWYHVLFVSVLAGLEKNLTNTSLYGISASLKTALHTLNVVFVLFFAALLGVDEDARVCLFRCHCRSNLALSVAVLIVLAGGLVTATWTPHDATGADFAIGVGLQCVSGVAYAVKTVVTKMLLGDARAEDFYLVEYARRPSTIQVAFVMTPVIGLTSLAFVPSVERTWDIPPGFWPLAVVVGVSVTGILVFQLQLTKLLSPLTVSVLAIVKDVVIVLFFLCYGGERFSKAQELGFAMSATGVLAYACAARRRRRSRGLGRSDSASSLGSAIEQRTFHDDGADGRSGACAAGAPRPPLTPPRPLTPPAG